MKSMKINLDGNGWEADYFLSEDQYNSWRSRSRNLENMLIDSALSSGFVRGAAAPGAMRGAIPGCDRTFLLENGSATDPFFGRNLEQTEWAEKHSWAFRRTFRVPDHWRGSRVRIDFKGIDYEALFFFNGELLGHHKGMFIPVGFDITGLVRFGEDNLIAVAFFPAPQGKPNHRDHEPADFAGFHRTQMGFGWDWSRKLVPTGIWDSVTVSAYENTRLRDWHFTHDGGKVLLSLEIESRSAKESSLSLSLKPYNFEGGQASCEKILALQPGSNQVDVEFAVSDIRRWEPNGYGFPALYTLEIMLDGESHQSRVGFRTLETRRNPDSPEGAYDQTFVINGTPVFARGVNWVPADLMASRVTPEDYEHLVDLAAGAGVNLFRVWGGGMIEKEAFYDACDRYGILVWQEFMHSCSNSPKDAEFLAFKRREGEAILRKLRNHVSLTLLCGGNEMQYYGEIPDSPMLRNYGELVRELAPGIPFHVSSPDLSRPGERGHGPWNWCEHADYNRHFRLLASELGCNGMPEYDSLHRFIPEPELKAGRGPALNYHFYNRTNSHDLGIPVREFAPADMEEFCRASMFAQADAAQYMMEHYRRLFPYASGCFFWQYNEPWPTCAWSLVDFYGVPKMALHALRRANAPVLLSLEDASWRCSGGELAAKWFITCDRPCSGTAKLSAMTVSGQPLFERSVAGRWEAGTHELAVLKEPVPSGELIAVFLELDGQPRNVRLYGSPDFGAAFRLPRTKLTVRRSPGRVTVTNTGNAVAVHVRLDFPELPPKQLRLSDNYLVIGPGESREVATTEAADRERLRITAWNIDEVHHAAL